MAIRMAAMDMRARESAVSAHCQRVHQMIDLPSPFAPLTDLRKSLQMLEALPDKSEATKLDIKFLREQIAHRQANPLPGDE